MLPSLQRELRRRLPCLCPKRSLESACQTRASLSHWPATRIPLPPFVDQTRPRLCHGKTRKRRIIEIANFLRKSKGCIGIVKHVMKQRRSASREASNKPPTSGPHRKATAYGHQKLVAIKLYFVGQFWRDKVRRHGWAMNSMMTSDGDRLPSFLPAEQLDLLSDVILSNQVRTGGALGLQILDFTWQSECQKFRQISGQPVG